MRGGEREGTGRPFGNTPQDVKVFSGTGRRGWGKEEEEEGGRESMGFFMGA